MNIAVEAPRKKNHIVQCTRCQSYGHTKSYCSRPYFCVKFGGEHNSTLCTKDPAAPATCALCGGEQPASYKWCIIYKNLQQARSKTHRPIHPTAAQTSTSQLVSLIPANFPLPRKSHSVPAPEPPPIPYSHVVTHINSRSPWPKSCLFSLPNSNRCSTNWYNRTAWS